MVEKKSKGSILGEEVVVVVLVIANTYCCICFNEALDPSFNAAAGAR